MSNRIDATFEKLRSKGEKAFVAYVSAGDPDLERSLQIMIALAEAGADILELGVPFSDPLADGVVNQAAAARALAAGSNSSRVFELIRRFRQTHEVPIVLFTYLNPVYTYGYSTYHEDASKAGADGILLLDLPPDEAAQNHEMADSAGLKKIRLIAPTTPPERIELLAGMAEGFIYALSRTGVTGSHGGPSAQIGDHVAAIKQHTEVPVCVGFGIATSEQAALVSSVADGIVVGSAIVKQVELHCDAPNVADKVRSFTEPLIAAVKEG
ncbi:MAG: tryptophan synthase subunit alpha [Roseibacillus sp.]|nr:tryptophan synthase subunit alpha [Roseibacillus sp.]